MSGKAVFPALFFPLSLCSAPRASGEWIYLLQPVYDVFILIRTVTFVVGEISSLLEAAKIIPDKIK